MDNKIGHLLSSDIADLIIPKKHTNDVDLTNVINFVLAQSVPIN